MILKSIIYYINSSFTLVRRLDRLIWLRLRARRASGATVHRARRVGESYNWHMTT
jgi:hypothetical protein